MAEVSEAAKARACALAKAVDPQYPAVPEEVGTLGFPCLTALARYVQAVSDAAKLADEELKIDGIERAATTPDGAARLALAPFILPDPVDPLADVFRDMGWMDGRCDKSAANLREELAKRGLKIVPSDD